MIAAAANRRNPIGSCPSRNRADHAHHERFGKYDAQLVQSSGCAASKVLGRQRPPARGLACGGPRAAEPPSAAICGRLNALARRMAWFALVAFRSMSSKGDVGVADTLPP